jgi:proteasome lid subunit RPN8/RPN11
MMNSDSQVSETQVQEPDAYRLTCDLDHLPTWDVPEDEVLYDMWLIEFPEAPGNSISFLPPVKPRKLPERIEFQGIFDFIDRTDYPYNDVDWPIMSKRMLEVLQSVGDFAHKDYPIVITNAEEGEERKYDSERYDYVVIQLLEALDVFDWEKSIYHRDPEPPHFLSSLDIEKVVLKKPEGGFPPLFCLDDSAPNASLPSDLYLSAKAKQALDAAGIKGIDYRPSENLD